MSYAQNDIREYWDSIGKPQHFVVDCSEFNNVDYIPYVAKTITAYNCNKDALDSLTKQFTLHKISGTAFTGSRFISTDIDVTYNCNLACPNCNRGSHLKKIATAKSNITIPFIKQFIREYKHLGKAFVVKLVGGEPTLHPNLREFMELLNEYFTVWVLTNGIKNYAFPDYVYVENSAKIRDVNPEFHATYDAPIDDELFKAFTLTDYAKGCSMLECGYGYNEFGMHPCTIGMNLNRLLGNGESEGYNDIKECEKSKQEYLSKICKMCGIFKKLGYHSIDKTLFPRVTENTYSKSWKFLEELA